MDKKLNSENMKACAKIVVIFYMVLMCVIAGQAQAQSIEMVRPADFRYYVVVDGDTVSTRSLEYKAIQDAVNYRADFPNSLIVVEPTGIEIRGDIPVIYETEFIYETVYDTVYADTVRYPVYSTINPDHNVLFNEVSWDIDIDYDTTITQTGEQFIDTTRSIDFIIDMMEPEVDTLYTEVRCGNEWVENNVFIQPAQRLFYGLIWHCNSPLTYQFKATNVNGWEETITNTYPLWMSTFNGMPPARYEPYWGNIEWKIDTDVLILTIPERSIARVIDKDVPTHRDIEVTVTEVVDTTHSTGIHLALRSSEQERQHSVETFLNNDGMGVSIFSDGSWSNPITFPVEWEYDVPITYTLRLIGDTLTVEVMGETYTYSSDVIGNTPDGSLTIGATGAGIYKIVDLEFNILD